MHDWSLSKLTEICYTKVQKLLSLFQISIFDCFGDMSLKKSQLIGEMLDIFAAWIDFTFARFSRLLQNFHKFQFRYVCIFWLFFSKLWLSSLLKFKAHENRTVGPGRIVPGWIARNFYHKHSEKKKFLLHSLVSSKGSDRVGGCLNFKTSTTFLFGGRYFLSMFEIKYKF